MEIHKLLTLTLIAVFLAAKTCRGEIVVASSRMDKSTSRLADDLINIVTSCYKGRINGVGVAGNVPSTVLRTLSVQHSIPVAIIDNIRTYKAKNVPFAPVRHRQKLNVFIIEAPSYEKLYGLIGKNIRYSIWWNHMASFFILDLSPGCSKARSYAIAAWYHNILNAKVMCSHHRSGRIIFNFNPFTSKAPVSWQQARLFRVDNHRFTLLHRAYQENETMCADIDYDKTDDLGGYAIRVQGGRENFSQITTDVRARGLYEFVSTRKTMFRSIFRCLNATPIFVPRQTTQNYDISPVLGTLENTWAIGRFMTAYPHTQAGTYIITQFRGHKSQLNKILSVIDVDSRYGMGVIYLITLIFFKFFVHQALVPALLNLIRMTSNTGFANLPNDTASRIFLGTLFFFVVTMQGIFQGDLAALLTKNIPLRNVDTIQDLENLGFKQVYTEHLSIHLLDGSDLQKNIIDSRNAECLQNAKNDSSGACIHTFTGAIIDIVQALNLHISKNPIEILHLAWEIRWSWPLEERVNRIIGRLVEADAFKSWYQQCNPINPSDFNVDEAVKSNVDFKIIEFHEMIFAFVILGIGLACATIVFIIELAIGYKCNCGIKIWCVAVPR